MPSQFNYIIHTNHLKNNFLSFGYKLLDLTTKYNPVPGYITCNNHIAGSLPCIASNEFYDIMKEFLLMDRVDWEIEQ
jgi:hypothetical protein